MSQQNIQVFDQFGYPKVYTDCGSGEGEGCDLYNQPTPGTPGDWANETPIGDTMHPPAQTPSSGINWALVAGAIAVLFFIGGRR